MRILITGGSGFIGAPIIKRLLKSKASHQILALTRNLKKSLPEAKNIDWIESDLDDLSSVSSVIQDFKPEIVIHLAWQDIPNFSAQTSIQNVNRSMELFELIWPLESCQKVLVSGTCAEYNSQTGSCSESDTIKPTDFLTWAKLALLDYLKTQTTSRDITLGWFRLFYVYGPNQREDSLIPSLIKNLSQRRMPLLKSSKSANDYIYVNDVAEIFELSLVTKFPSGVYNLGSGNLISTLEVCKTVEMMVLGKQKNSEKLEQDAKKTTVDIKSHASNCYASTKLTKEIFDWEAKTQFFDGVASMCLGDQKVYESIQRCRICDSEHLKEVINLGNQPPANSLYNAHATKPPLVPLRLLFCEECTTVQLGESVDPRYLFSDYVWVTGTSNMAKEHSDYFLDNALLRIKKTYPSVIDIGSNDGTFLESFKKAGCQVLGIDPAKNIAIQATANGIPTLAEFFNEDVANRVRSDQGEVDVIMARNVIPHVKEIHSVIGGMGILLDDDGIGIIEFHSAGLIMSELHYDSIYHEHLFYFSLKTIAGLLKRHNLHVFDLTTSPISGGSWVIYFSKDIKPKSAVLKQAEHDEKISGLNSYETWLEFSKQVKNHSEELKQIIQNQKTKVLAYGASARSSTLLNYCAIDFNHISSVIDKNPMKLGLLTPGTHIPIISFEEGLDQINEETVILLLAWNLASEVMAELRANNYTGNFIIPLPNMPKVINQ